MKRKFAIKVAIKVRSWTKFEKRKHTKRKKKENEENAVELRDVMQLPLYFRKITNGLGLRE